jgi:type II secretory ATPase GspE/PulE/Tfp pilus assembly ATPase PilB-like protein
VTVTLAISAAVPLLPVAVLSHPSLGGFPLGGLFTWIAFTTTAAAAISAGVWMHKQHETYGIARIEAWMLGISSLLAVLVVGTMQLGPLTIAAAFLALPGLVFYFVKQRDRRVRPADRILVPGGIREQVARFQQARRERQAARALKPKQPAKPLTERLKDFGGRLRSLVVRKKPEPKEEGPRFKLLKKDGSPALAEAAEEEGGMTENLVNLKRVMIEAMKIGATDVHVEPQETQYVVRHRVDGVLKDAVSFSTAAGKGVISALKVAADMDISERRRPQDGTFSADYEGSKYDIRAASTPTSYGEKMVLRLLNSSGGVMKAGLTNIGMRKQILDPLREIIHKPYGMFLVTGPTGSGKTTTVYASLAEIDAKQHNVTTIEDPVEYRLDGITQIAVNTAAGVTFAGILRSVLRQDPDVLLVGEIRDKETAEIACQAALTGHFVFSTLHANDTVATITRMLDLGLDPMLIQTAVTAVLAQRLARRLCPACREAYPPPPDFFKRTGLRPEVCKVIYRSKGCPECGNTGYKGRVGLHELMVVNPEIQGLITAHPNVTELRAAARKAGTRSLQTDGMLKVVAGVTSIDEVLRVTT